MAGKGQENVPLHLPFNVPITARHIRVNLAQAAG